MAKDAKGHGSNGKGAAIAPKTISAREQREIAQMRLNAENAKAMFKQLAKEKKAGKPAPSGRLFQNSPKEARQLGKVVKAEAAREKATGVRWGPKK